ncbi:uncharacterized protein TNCV_2756411 [Trichonephila clavipes]|nr:uncharacterized protein TNCV_2756411 [Trichonephila clavipes]
MENIDINRESLHFPVPNVQFVTSDEEPATSDDPCTHEFFPTKLHASLCGRGRRAAASVRSPRRQSIFASATIQCPKQCLISSSEDATFVFLPGIRSKSWWVEESMTSKRQVPCPPYCLAVHTWGLLSKESPLKRPCHVSRGRLYSICLLAFLTSFFLALHIVFLGYPRTPLVCLDSYRGNAYNVDGECP